MNVPDFDPELKAIQEVIAALEPLDEASRTRVIGYAFDRLGIATSGGNAGSRGTALASQREREQRTPVEPRKTLTDIRALTAEKQPQSANEMAALVGYYLAEMAPDSARKSEVTTNDIKEYFKQGNYPLPSAPEQTLRNAAAAGYFEKLGGGQFRLNPVGHNLVAHSLPRKGESASAPTARKARRPTRARTSTRAKQPKQSKTKRRTSRS
jgi:hypothetical protein